MMVLPRAYEVPIARLAGNSWITIPDRKAIVGEDGTVYNIVSSKYKLVLHQEVVDVVKKVLNDFGIKPLHEKVELSRNYAVMLYSVMTDRKIISDDELWFGFTVTNSYDGSLGIGFNISGLRLVCENGLMFARSLFKTPKIRHLKTLLEPNYEKIAESIQIILEHLDEIVDLIEMSMKSTISPIELVDFIERTFKDVPLIKKKIYAILRHNGIDLTPYVEEYQKAQGQATLIEEFLERLENDEINIWEVYNHITNVLTHKRGRVDLPKIYELQQKASKLLAYAQA